MIGVLKVQSGPVKWESQGRIEDRTQMLIIQSSQYESILLVVSLISNCSNVTFVPSHVRSWSLQAVVRAHLLEQWEEREKIREGKR